MSDKTVTDRKDRGLPSSGPSGSRPPYWKGEAWDYEAVPHWRWVVCKLIGHRWAFVIDRRPSGKHRYACGRCGQPEKVGW